MIAFHFVLATKMVTPSKQTCVFGSPHKNNKNKLSAGSWFLFSHLGRCRVRWGRSTSSRIHLFPKRTPSKSEVGFGQRCQVVNSVIFRVIPSIWVACFFGECNPPKLVQRFSFAYPCRAISNNDTIKRKRPVCSILLNFRNLPLEVCEY